MRFVGTTYPFGKVHSASSEGGGTSWGVHHLDYWLRGRRRCVAYRIATEQALGGVGRYTESSALQRQRLPNSDVVALSI